MAEKILIAMLLATVAAIAPLAAQEETDTTRVEFHMSVGGTVAAGFGRSEVLSWVAPRATWHATDRLDVRGGMMVAGSLMPNGYRLQGLYDRSLAPRRQGTQVGAVWAEADYAVNNRLRIWASVMHVSGFAQPLWLDGAVPIEATVLSGGFAYALTENSLLEMHFHVAHDHYGYMLHPPYGHGYYGAFVPSWELYSAPWPF